MSVVRARLKIKEWREDPVRFVVDCFKIEPDEWQRDAMMLLGGTKERRRVCLRACTGPGKSALLAWAGWHRLLCFAGRGEHPKGAALSGEGRDNLRDNLWAELSKWQQRSEIFKTAFTWTKELIFANDHPQTWFLAARSYAKDADSEAVGRSLSGLHAEYPFVLLDEIGDMPLAVGQKAEQIFTGGCKDGLILGAGNPTSTTGLLYQIASQLREQWNIIRITADPDDPKRAPRVDIEHAKEMIKTYGRDNPWIMATILGEFPESGFNTLLSISDVEKAMDRVIKEDVIETSQRRIGVDVARFGDDRTVLFPRQGLVAFKPIEMRGARTNEIAARVMQEKSRWNSEMEFIDDTGGWGAGVIDSMLQAGLSPYPVNFSSKAIDPRYLNKRAEMWFVMAEWIKTRGSLPKDQSLAKELISPTYAFQNGKFHVEPKEKIKDRLGFSPDYADALALTFAIPDMPSRERRELTTNRYKTQHEFDPFREL